MKHRTRDEHLFGPAPKRILALDGGGIRGALTLEYLKRIEDILCQRAGGDPEFRLSDYFDLIGGTSTGAIIATGLALGFSVEKLQTLYRELAAAVFRKSIWRLGIFVAKFPETSLNRVLKNYLGENTLGSDELRTGLMVMVKRLDTGSPWVIHNNPRGKYFNPRGETSTAVPNRDFLLRRVVRASTAAPHYFEPERLRVAERVDGAFVDGGVSPFNNPALQLLMLASLEGYGLKWPLGPDNLLLVSVGTGYKEVRLAADEVMDMPAALLSLRALVSLMNDSDWLGQTLLQWMSHCPTPWVIDREIGDLQQDTLGSRKLLSYLRYNVHFDSAWLNSNLDISLDVRQLEGLHAMDRPENVEALASLGAMAAAAQVKGEHFPASFDFS